MAGVLEKIDEFQRASELFLKGSNYTEIARELDCTPAYAKSLVIEYKRFVAERVNEDPDFLDRVADNTLQVLDEINLLTREAWQVVEKTKEFEVIPQQIAALKLASELTDKRAKLLQLMGAKADSGSAARMQRAERVNEIVSQVIKEIISGCPRCKPEAQVKLAQAFELMGKEDEITDPEPIDNIIDAESTEDAI